MWFNLLLGLPVMVLCLFLQALLVIIAIRYYLRKQSRIGKSSLLVHMMMISSVMILLVIGNLGQIALWAGLFRILGEFPVFNTAFYHSAVNFSSLGYGDMIMSDKHKLLGALEAINGVLMIGISTAALMTAFQHASKKYVVTQLHTGVSVQTRDSLSDQV